MSDPSGPRATDPVHDLLSEAGVAAGVPTEGAALIRDGVNVLYRLPGAIIARIGPPGSYDTAVHLVRVSRWLATIGLPAVRVLDSVRSPTMVGDRPVTWWAELPEHRHATPSELGAVLKRIHALAAPRSLPLPVLDPFSGVGEVITGAAALSDQDRAWLTGLLSQLRRDYADLQSGRTRHVIHGDAWQGNVAVPEDGTPVLLDLDRFGLGLREWDLMPLAVDFTDFARITRAEYDAFVEAYGGYDVTTQPGYRTLATATELRWTAFALGKANSDPAAVHEARHRLACLRGDVERPWQWTAF